MPWGLKRYYGAGGLHFITWSCYRRRPLLDTELARDLLLNVLELMRERYRFGVVGYVVMPEHVHTLVSEPQIGDPSTVVQAVKLGFVRRVMSGRQNPHVSQRTRDMGHPPAPNHIWQRRFYDFNVWSQRKEIEKLKYAPESGGPRTGGEARRLAVEQLPILRLWRGWAGSNQRLEMVGEEDSGEDGVMGNRRVEKAPLLAQKAREKWGTRLAVVSNWFDVHPCRL